MSEPSENPIPIIATVDYRQKIPRLILRHIGGDETGIEVDSEAYAMALAEAINWVTARYFAGEIK